MQLMLLPLCCHPLLLYAKDWNSASIRAESSAIVLSPHGPHLNYVGTTALFATIPFSKSVRSSSEEKQTAMRDMDGAEASGACHGL
jgi:hypothetical protein